MGDAAEGAPAPAIELRDVTKVYAGSTDPAVDGLTLDVPAGELVVLVGPSGCGKTTTLRMLNRLEEPTSGEIRILGEDVRSRPVHELRRQIGYVIQGVGLFPHLTIAENIATVPRLLGWPRDRRTARIDELADLVDLDRSMLSRYPAELSGGQQQRVGVARALAADPPVLLMDEPYSAVDPIVRARLQDELVELHQRLGTTIVLVTHDIDEAIKVGDRIAVLAVGGRLAQYATPVDLLGAPASDFVASFLGGERSLRRLALVPLGDLELDPLDGPVDSAPTMDVRGTAREALDVLLRSGAASVVVTRDGTALGSVGLATLSATVRDGADGADGDGADGNGSPA
ncbi:ABC transporter ATP-binding protein [Dermatobacter hominis]|uniref:ABC transporter ATP-binding protein n=1 Tax=Dermatobacter hominis TaxID=2884263 RepID=UPI001D10CB8C|nr:ABC transporter ATP-binding protein [Dermatobacter hominis]UDY35133.1 ABC transporter ATP-binding protein [Dermatobacter hominis]